MLVAMFRNGMLLLWREGLGGVRFRIKWMLRYWHFRLLVFWLRKQDPNQDAKRWTGTKLGSAPTFSILLPVNHARPSWLREAVNSVRAQSYGNWELCIGLSEVTLGIEKMVRVTADRDLRIRVLKLEGSRGISMNSNRLAREARGEFLTLLSQDDYLEPHALLEMAVRVGSGRFDLLYTDEDVVSPWMKIPFPPNLKPDWAPDSFLSFNYIGHLCCFRRTLFEEVEGFRSDYDSTQDYDLFLRLVEKTDRIAHIPKVLYHGRGHGLFAASGKKNDAGSPAKEAARLALESHLQRYSNETAHVETGNNSGILRVHYPRRSDPLVDIIIPSMNHENTLVRCFDSIERLSRYPNYRITVMLNGPANFGELLTTYDGHNRIRFRHYTETFNFSRINNVAAMKSEGEVLLFLNDDIEITQADWLEGLLEHALRKEVGAVGPMLLYPNGTIQHAGISVDPDWIAFDFHKGLPESGAGYDSRAQTVQNVSVVTGACLCTRRECFLDVGGFDEDFPLAYNDVDYCLKLIEKKRHVVYTPFVRAIHHESLTRGFDHHGGKKERLNLEIERMRNKWGAEGLRDRYFNPGIFMPNAPLKRLAAEYLISSKASE